MATETEQRSKNGGRNFLGAVEVDSSATNLGSHCWGDPCAWPGSFAQREKRPPPTLIPPSFRPPPSCWPSKSTRAVDGMHQGETRAAVVLFFEVFPQEGSGLRILTVLSLFAFDP